jgi:iron(III) transport system permease protein
MLQHLKNFWRWSWGGKTPDSVLITITMITTLIMVIPFVYILYRSIFAGADRWLSLLDGDLYRLLWNTLGLTFVVAIGAVSIGVSLAWLVIRTDLPGKTWLRWILALPLVIPPYVGAMAYIILIGPRSTFSKWWEQQRWLPESWQDYPLDIYSFWGLAFVLTIFTYPYVFLVVSASLRKMNRNFEDMARSQGFSLRQIFWKINIPFMRPAIGAGAILVILYVLSDFGAVAMLRYTTFTSAIFYEMGNYDTMSASILSLVLIMITILVLWLESRNKKNVTQNTTSARPPESRALGAWKPLAVTYVMMICLISVILPIAVLLYWSSIGIQSGILNAEFLEYSWNSFQIAGAAAIICMLLGLPLVYLKSRYPSWISSITNRSAYIGYSLPGVIIALGLIFIFNQYIPMLYNTVFVIVIAMLIRFLPQSMQSTEASLSLISPRIDEASQSLGLSPWMAMYKVILPIILPGILAGGALVFVSTLKELPATLLLRPPGFDTLAVRIWIEAMDASYYEAAPAALLIILISILPLKWMLDR